MISPQSKAVNGYLLNRVVLVLNSNYAPMTVCTAKRAICLQVLRRVDVIEKYDEKIISSEIESIKNELNKKQRKNKNIKVLQSI